MSDLPKVTLPTWTRTHIYWFICPSLNTWCWNPTEVIQFPRPHRNPLNNIPDMWLFALYLIVPLTHSSYKVTAAISEISLYQWSKSSPQLFLAFGPEPRSINLIPPPLRGHPSKLSVCKNSTPLGLPSWYSGKTPFLMQEAQVQSLVSKLRSHMLSSQKTTKKLNIPSSHLVFTMRCCYGCHQGMMSENPRSFLPSHFLPPFDFHFTTPLRCLKWNHA